MMLLKLLWLSVIWMLLLSCAHRIPQDMAIDQFSYKRKLKIKVNGRWYESPSVLPRSAKYEAKAWHGADMDYLFSETCASEYEVEDAGRLDRWVFQPNPIDLREQANYCPWKIESFEKEGRYGFQYFDFEHPDYKAEATVVCNDVRKRVGVDVCELKVGRLSEIEFRQNTIAEHAIGACPLKRLDSQRWEMSAERAECIFIFTEVDSGREFKFTLLGYDRPVLLEL